MGRNRKKPLVIEYKKYKDSSEGWMPTHVELPPIDPLFKNLNWSINVEVLLSNNIVVESVYYRHNAKVWSKHNSKVDFSCSEVIGWRNIT